MKFDDQLPSIEYIQLQQDLGLVTQSNMNCIMHIILAAGNYIVLAIICSSSELLLKVNCTWDTIFYSGNAIPLGTCENA